MNPNQYRICIHLPRSGYEYMSLPMDLDDALDYARTLVLNGMEEVSIKRCNVVPALGPMEN